ncbi:MAG: hypothetical protein JO356_13730 [Acidobacteria bacterium]|nr:hypothetical protein [Acidobacteriota bacterium]
MHSRYRCVLAWSAIGLSGCGVIPGTSFAPPPHSTLSSIQVIDIATAKSKAAARQAECNSAADTAANAPQVLDLPTIAAGVVGVSAGIFGAPVTVAEGAAVGATSLYATRSYYQFPARETAYSAGAAALGCIRGAAETLTGLDGELPNWKVVYTNWALSNTTEAALAIRRLEPLAISAPGRLDGAISDIEGLVRAKIGSPAAPDISGYLAKYEANMTSTKAAHDQNKTATDPATPRMSGGVAAATAFEAQAIALLKNTTVTDALTDLDQTLDGCRLKAR